MEWELEFDFDIKDYIEVFSRQEKVGYIFDLPKFRRFIKSLLASSQDSFRRKVEDAVKELPCMQCGKDSCKKPQISINEVLARLKNIK